MPSVPHWVRVLCRASLCDSAGPRNFFQTDTASSPISSMATTGPEDKKCTELLENKSKAEAFLGEHHMTAGRSFELTLIWSYILVTGSLNNFAISKRPMKPITGRNSLKERLWLMLRIKVCSLAPVTLQSRVTDRPAPHVWIYSICTRKTFNNQYGGWLSVTVQEGEKKQLCRKVISSVFCLKLKRRIKINSNSEGTIWKI